LIDNVSMWWK